MDVAFTHFWNWFIYAPMEEVLTMAAMIGFIITVVLLIVYPD